MLVIFCNLLQYCMVYIQETKTFAVLAKLIGMTRENNKKLIIYRGACWWVWLHFYGGSSKVPTV